MKNQKRPFNGIVFLILLFFGMNSYAADKTWIYHYSVPDKSVRFHDMISVSSGGYLGVGDVWDAETGDTAQNAFMSRIQEDGQVLWSRNFTFPGRWYDELRSVVECGDGGFIATGKALLDGTTEHGSPSLVSAVLILKVDAGGNLVWSKLLKNYANNSSYGHRIKATGDGSYVVAGEKIAYVWNEQYSVYTYVTSGALLTKIDADGQILFSRSYYGDWLHSWRWKFNDVVQDQEGACYAVGYASVEAYSQGIGLGGMLLVKTDSGGNLVWVKKVDSAQGGEPAFATDDGERILILDNALYVTGITGGTFTLGKYSLSGAHLWTKQYFCNRSYDTAIGDITDFIHSGDGNFFILTCCGCKTITKVNPQGDVLWARFVHTWPGMPTSLGLESDKALTVGGWGSKTGFGTIAIAGKYDSLGNACEENSEVTYTVVDFEMLANTVPDNAALWMNISEGIPAFSGPTLAFEKYCGTPGPLVCAPEIRANGQKDPVTTSPGEPVSITIHLDPGDAAGQNADWWIGVITSFAHPFNWLTYVYPAGWQLGINPCFQAPVVSIPSFEVFNMALPVGNYTFFFALDEPDGKAIGPWFGVGLVDVAVR